MAVLGTKLMDLYTGALWPRDISAKVLGMLGAEGRLELAAFREWVGRQGDYAVVTFPEDGSRWVLRVGDEAERYVHLHPGRWSPATVRVRANVLKTAFLVLAHTALHGGGPLDRALINEVRREYLGLAPLGKDPEGEAGLGAVIELLREPTVAPRQGERGALARVYRVIPTVVHLPNGKAKPDNPLRRHFSGDPPRKRRT
jgi:hypothetical protein